MSGPKRKRVKRQQIWQVPLPADRPAPMYNRGDSHCFERADIAKGRLLREARYLTGVGDPRGEQLRAVALSLPLASLERMFH